MAGKKIGAQVPGSQGVVVAETLRARARNFVATIGLQKSSDRLHVGKDTLEAACHRGPIMRSTADRLAAALDREEPLLEERKAS